MQPQLGRRSPHVGRFPPDQRADTSTATKTAATLPGAAGSRGATVNQPPKSVVREICTPRSVGTGGGRPPPVTRWAPGNGRPYRDIWPEPDHIRILLVSGQQTSAFGLLRHREFDRLKSAYEDERSRCAFTSAAAF